MLIVFLSVAYPNESQRHYMLTDCPHFLSERGLAESHTVIIFANIWVAPSCARHTSIQLQPAAVSWDSNIL